MIAFWFQSFGSLDLSTSSHELRILPKLNVNLCIIVDDNSVLTSRVYAECPTIEYFTSCVIWNTPISNFDVVFTLKMYLAYWKFTTCVHQKHPNHAHLQTLIVIVFLEAGKIIGHKCWASQRFCIRARTQRSCTSACLHWIYFLAPTDARFMHMHLWHGIMPNCQSSWVRWSWQ